MDFQIKKRPKRRRAFSDLKFGKNKSTNAVIRERRKNTCSNHDNILAGCKNDMNSSKALKQNENALSNKHNYAEKNESDKDRYFGQNKENELSVEAQLNNCYKAKRQKYITKKVEEEHSNVAEVVGLDLNMPASLTSCNSSSFDISLDVSPKTSKIEDNYFAWITLQKKIAPDSSAAGIWNPEISLEKYLAKCESPLFLKEAKHQDKLKIRKHQNNPYSLSATEISLILKSPADNPSVVKALLESVIHEKPLRSHTPGRLIDDFAEGQRETLLGSTIKVPKVWRADDASVLTTDDNVCYLNDVNNSLSEITTTREKSSKIDSKTKINPHTSSGHSPKDILVNKSKEELTGRVNLAVEYEHGVGNKGLDCAEQKPTEICRYAQNFESGKLKDKNIGETKIGEIQTLTWDQVPLPPGWVKKVSTELNKTYFVHLGYGSTWNHPLDRESAIVSARQTYENIPESLRRDGASKNSTILTKDSSQSWNDSVDVLDCSNDVSSLNDEAVENDDFESKESSDASVINSAEGNLFISKEGVELQIGPLKPESQAMLQIKQDSFELTETSTQQLSDSLKSDNSETSRENEIHEKDGNCSVEGREVRELFPDSVSENSTRKIKKVASSPSQLINAKKLGKDLTVRSGKSSSTVRHKDESKSKSKLCSLQNLGSLQMSISRKSFKFGGRRRSDSNSHRLSMKGVNCENDGELSFPESVEKKEQTILKLLKRRKLNI